MVLYNFGASIILGADGIGSQPMGIALWPAVMLHAMMTVWCIASLLGGNAAQATNIKPATTVQ